MRQPETARHNLFDRDLPLCAKASTAAPEEASPTPFAPLECAVRPRRNELDTCRTPILRIALLTLAAVCVHGYHLGVDDSGIYLPAVFKVIHPNLYPYGAEFFLAHARLSAFSAIVGASARLLRLTISSPRFASLRLAHADDDLVVFLWHIATVLLFLLAAWQLAKALFTTNRARWSALLASAATLTVPVAGTALVIMDPYLTARSASTPLTVLAAAAWLEGRRSLALAWIVLAFLVHPLMAAYGLLGLGFLALPTTATKCFYGRFALLPAMFVPALIFAALTLTDLGLAARFSFAPVSPAYEQAISMRSFLFLSSWAWWEWLGLAAPIAILVWLGRVHPRGASPIFGRTSRSLALLGIFTIGAGLLFSLGPARETLAWLQPARAFQLIYVFLFPMMSGLLGEYVPSFQRPTASPNFVLASLPSSVFFAVLAAGMFGIQRHAFAHSRQIEWPWTAPQNCWVAAFQWVRENTPQDAVFALDPDYIEIPGEEQHGFRAIAQRSMLSDYYKDSGVVSVFPELAGQWQREQQALRGWKTFSETDFQQLAQRYPVSWVVLQGSPPPGLKCPYTNPAVAVCRIPAARGL